MTGEGERRRQRAVFIVRLDSDDRGRISGVVERVRTGEKVRLDTLDSVGEILAALLARDEAEPTA